MLWILLSKKYQFLIVEVGLILARRANYMDCYSVAFQTDMGLPIKIVVRTAGFTVRQSGLIGVSIICSVVTHIKRTKI